MVIHVAQVAYLQDDEGIFEHSNERHDDVGRGCGRCMDVAERWEVVGNERDDDAGWGCGRCRRLVEG